MIEIEVAAINKKLKDIIVIIEHNPAHVHNSPHVLRKLKMIDADIESLKSLVQTHVRLMIVRKLNRTKSMPLARLKRRYINSMKYLKVSSLLRRKLFKEEFSN